MADLTRAVKRHQASERDLHEEIYRASRAGNSLRTIATVTRLSHESVRVIVQRVDEWVKRDREILASPAAALSVDAQLRTEASRRRRLERLEYLLGVKELDESTEEA